MSYAATPSEAGGTPSLFGSSVPIGPDAPPFEQVLARSARDPRWSSS